MRGKVELPRFESSVLANNRLRDPIDREVLVYLPPSYDGGGRFPVIMILPPYAAGHRSLLGWKLWEPDLFERYEAQLASGEATEAILVSPDCLTRWGGSQFIDSGMGDYQRYLVEEVVPFIDARYRTIPERSARGVLGRSSGGYGALRLGIDRPEAFAAYASHAGDAAFEVSIRPSFTSAAIALAKAGGLDAFLDRFAREGAPPDFEVIMTIATAAAYAAIDDPPYFALPFDPRTALPIPDVWARFLDHDPLVRLERDPRAMTSAALILLDAGDRDEHGLQFGARLVHAQLASRGANVVHEEFAGGHRGTAHRYAWSIPKMLAALDKPER